MAKIISLLTNDNVFAVYKEKKDGEIIGKREAVKNIYIKGGANVRDKNFNLGDAGVTEVTAAELKLLQADQSFKDQVDNGWLFVDKMPPNVKKDNSAPLTKSDIKAKNADADVKAGSEK